MRRRGISARRGLSRPGRRFRRGQRLRRWRLRVWRLRSDIGRRYGCCRTSGNGRPRTARRLGLDGDRCSLGRQGCRNDGRWRRRGLDRPGVRFGHSFRRGWRGDDGRTSRHRGRRRGRRYCRSGRGGQREPDLCFPNGDNVGRRQRMSISDLPAIEQHPITASEVEYGPSPCRITLQERVTAGSRGIVGREEDVGPVASADQVPRFRQSLRRSTVYLECFGHATSPAVNLGQLSLVEWIISSDMIWKPSAVGRSFITFGP